MRFLIPIATLCVAPLLATDHFNHGYYGGGLDYSKLNLNSAAGYGHGHESQIGHAQPPVMHAASHGHAVAPAAEVTKSVHKEVYAVKPVYEKHYSKEGHYPHISVKFRKEPVLAYGVHPKGTSTTFSLPLFSAKKAPIITLTNKFPRDWH